MCRFIAYAGRDILLADLIVNPEHSLINQSYQSQQRSERLNGDGFGVGWYNRALSKEPGIFTATSPAWSNRNLRRLADKIVSPLVFAHIRAASPEFPVNELNCHPFYYHHLMWMHNGRIDNFLKIKRPLRNSLRDDIYNTIQGTTDSEHAFAAFLNFLPQDLSTCNATSLKSAMLSTIAQLNQWTRDSGAQYASQYNFAVTDGETIVITRYTDAPETIAETLYFSRGERFECQGNVCRVISPKEKPHAIVVASEALTPEARWEPVPANHILVIGKDLKIDLEPILV